MRVRIRPALAAVLVPALLLAACGDDGDSDAEDDAQEQADDAQDAPGDGAAQEEATEVDPAEVDLIELISALRDGGAEIVAINTFPATRGEPDVVRVFDFETRNLDSTQAAEVVRAVPGVAKAEPRATLGQIFGKRVIVIGGGAQVAQVNLGAVSEADRHNLRGERISVDTIPLVGEEDLAAAVRAVADLPRARCLVLARRADGRRQGDGLPRGRRYLRHQGEAPARRAGGSRRARERAGQGRLSVHRPVEELVDGDVGAVDVDGVIVDIAAGTVRILFRVVPELFGQLVRAEDPWIDPAAAVLASFTRLERMLRQKVDVSNTDRPGSRVTTRALGELASEQGLWSDKELAAFRDLIPLRNLAAHGEDVVNLDESRAYEFAELALQLMIALLLGSGETVFPQD